MKYKNNNKILTIAIVLFDQSQMMIKRLFNSIIVPQEIKEKVEIIILSDNPFLKKEIFFFINSFIKREKFINIKFFSQKNNNIGKTNLIIKHLDKFNGIFLKIIDGDDKLSHNIKWIKLLNALEKNKDKSILITKYERTREVTGNKEIKKVTHLGYFSKYSSLNFEPKIMYNISVLKKIFTKRVPHFLYMDDQLRIWKSLQYNPLYKRIGYYFTVYSTDTGMTNKEQINYFDYIDEMISVFKLLETIKIKGYWFRHNMALYFLPRLIKLNTTKNIISNKEILDIVNKVSYITKINSKKILKK